MSFKNDMLDGFDILYNRTSSVLKSTNEMRSFFKKLAKIEAEHVIAMKKVMKSAQKKVLQNQNLDGKLRNSFCSIVSEVENIANQHTNLSTKKMDIVNEFISFIKEKEQRRKKLHSDGLALTKDMKDQRDLLSKTHANYLKASKEAENAQISLVKAQADTSIKPNKLAQVNAKSTAANEKARNADSEYQDVLRDTNQKQALFYETTMPSHLQEFQNFEEERLEFIRQLLSEFIVSQKELPVLYKNSVLAMEENVEVIDVSADIVSFVEQNKTGISPPPPIDYEGYDGNTKVTCIPASAKSKSKQKQKENQANISPTEKVWGLTDADKVLDTQAKINKLHEHKQEISDVLKSEEQQRDGLRRLVQFYDTDPINKKKTEEELVQSEANVALREKQKQIIINQLCQLESDRVSDDSCKEENESSKVKINVRGLYDYTATCETELSFLEGDPMTITEQDESGWWYAELKGKEGFIPQNYVEIIPPSSI